MRTETRAARFTPALAAIVLVLGACTTETGSSATSLYSTPSPLATPPQPDELEWERLTDEAVTPQSVRQPEVDDATLNPNINDICPLPTGEGIAIGSHGADQATPAVWVTEDGERWETAVVDGEPFGGGFNALHRCDADRNRTYVVGAHGSPHSAAVWTTIDGREFERLDHGAFPDFTSVADIEVFADGLVWIVGPIWVSEGDGASTIVEMDDTAPSPNSNVSTRPSSSMRPGLPTFRLSPRERMRSPCPENWATP